MQCSWKLENTILWKPYLMLFFTCATQVLKQGWWSPPTLLTPSSRVANRLKWTCSTGMETGCTSVLFNKELVRILKHLSKNLNYIYFTLFKKRKKYTFWKFPLNLKFSLTIDMAKLKLVKRCGEIEAYSIWEQEDKNEIKLFPYQ